MGVNYQSRSYNQTYGGDYQRSYEGSYSHGDLRHGNYKRVGKEANDSLYGNDERSRSKDWINPAGNRDRIERNITADVKPRSKADSKRTSTLPPPHIVTEGNNEHPSVSQAQPQRRNRDYSYIDKSSLNHPIIVFGKDKYQDIYTKEVISVSAARERLEYAGYKAKMPISTKSLIIYGSIALFVPFIGPIALISFGSAMKKKEMTDFEKVLQGRKLTYALPALKSEIDKSVAHGTTATVMGVVFAVLQYYFLFM